MCLMTREWPQKWWAAGMPWPSWANTRMMCSPQSHCSRACVCAHTGACAHSHTHTHTHTLLFSWIRKSPCQSYQLLCTLIAGANPPQGFGFLTLNHSGSRSPINPLFTTHLKIFWEKRNVSLLLFIANNLRGWRLGWLDYLAVAAAAVAAVAALLQLCPTLCDPIDSSPPGFPVPGIPQARTLEWVTISFSNAWKWKVKGKSLSRVRLCATPWTAAYQAPLSMGFSRQEYWSGVPLPSPYIFTNIYI